MNQHFLRRRVLVADLITGDIHPPAGVRISKPTPRSARVLVRLHHHPVGTVEIDNQEVTIDAIRCASLKQLGRLINSHLDVDGIEAVKAPDDFASLPAVESCHLNPHVVPQTTPFVTVAIATMDNPDSCRQTVMSILASSYSNFELLVIDNSPSKATRDAVAEIDDERVRYIEEPRRGLSVVRNRGLAEAKGEFIVFSDDDVIADRFWLTAIVKAFMLDNSVSCVTGSILAAELETPAQLMLEQFGGFNKGSQRQIFDMGEHRRESPLYPYAAGRFGSGANMAFRIATLQTLGGFAEDLGAGTTSHGGEDIDILRRVVHQGHVLVYEPAALIWHAHRRSYRALERQMFRYGVGLSATITKWMLESPRTTWDILRRVPAGLHYALSPHSQKNENKATHYPSMLTRLEILGFVAGPVNYLRARNKLQSESK